MKKTEKSLKKKKHLLNLKKRKERKNQFKWQKKLKIWNLL